MTNLNTLIPALKRAVAVPGQFATAFPNTLDPDLLGSLGDGFGRVQLIGFLPDTTIDAALTIVSPDLTPGASMLVVLFAAEQMLTMRMLDLNARATYQAGPTKYETEKSASMLTAVIKGLQEQRKEIIDYATGAGRTRGAFAMSDIFTDRMYCDFPSNWTI